MTFSNKVSLCFMCFIGLFIFFIRPANGWHKLAIGEIKNIHKLVIGLTLVFTILACILPMPLSPYWNGTLHWAADMQQYGRLADALLDGHLYIDKGDIDPLLEAMDNPYDTDAREKLGVKSHWDEVYYNHHYYTYFGVVPTVILFIPYRLLTGNMLLSYQATQFFSTLAIIGMFYLLFMLSKLLFSKFPFSLYLILSVTLSVLCIGYSIAAPALYCTAIVSAICLMVWSFIFLIKASWCNVEALTSKKFLFIGGLLGAMAFGCRPPVALANIILIPIILHIKNRKNVPTQEKIHEMAYLLFPYFALGVLLMLYNYARFGNVFEFGVSYQLTITDQHLYQDFGKRFNIKRLLDGFLFLMVGCKYTFIKSFPHVNMMFLGVFIKYPILVLTIHLFSEKNKKLFKNKEMLLFFLVLNFAAYVIAVNDIYWTPVPHPRYQLDFTYLLCLVVFVCIGIWLQQLSGKKRMLMIGAVVFLSFSALFVQFLLFCTPFDISYTMCYPDVLLEIEKGLLFDY